MYLQHFGLTHDPLGKSHKGYIDNKQYTQLSEHLAWLLETKGIGLITGEAGTGKTSAVRKWLDDLNPHQYVMHYQSDNQFRPFDIYCQLADKLGLEREARYSRLWRSLKIQLLHLHEEKKTTAVWILDEAHHLPINFLMELPSFLNFSFDTQEVMIILLIGTPKLQGLMQRAGCSSLASRLQFHYQWRECSDFLAYAKLVSTALTNAGRHDTLFSDSGMQLIYLASKGRLRYTHRIITRALQLACAKKESYLSDEIVNLAIEELRTMTA